MSLINKRRMQERERRNGLSDTIEVQKFFMPQVVETKSVKSLSIDNASLMNAAYSIPCEEQKEYSQVHGHVEPTESQIQFLTQQWPLAHQSKPKFPSLPQDAYFDIPIIIDPASYQKEQDESFNVSPEQLKNLPIAQIPCTNADCVHCKPPSAS